MNNSLSDCVNVTIIPVVTKHCIDSSKFLGFVANTTSMNGNLGSQ